MSTLADFERRAIESDHADPLAAFRSRFFIPPGVIYMGSPRAGIWLRKQQFH